MPINSVGADLRSVSRREENVKQRDQSQYLKTQRHGNLAQQQFVHCYPIAASRYHDAHPLLLIRPR